MPLVNPDRSPAGYRMSADTRRCSSRPAATASAERLPCGARLWSSLQFGAIRPLVGGKRRRAAPDARGEAVPSPTGEASPRSAVPLRGRSHPHRLVRAVPGQPSRSRSSSRGCWSSRRSRLTMSVREDQDVMDLDFRHTVTRPDLVGAAYRKRPGLFLTDVLRDLRSSGSPAILFNGNNVGWWGNQFVIRRKQLRFKPKGPIFDDGDLPHPRQWPPRVLPARSLADSRSSTSSFRARRWMSATPARWTCGRCAPLPRCGLSGFPLIRNGQRVWEQNGEQAWDPGSPVRPRRVPQGRARRDQRVRPRHDQRRRGARPPSDDGDRSRRAPATWS